MNFYLFFVLGFPEFSFEWFPFRKFDNFRIFCNLSQAISIPFVAVSKKIWNFWMNGKYPCFLFYRFFDGTTKRNLGNLEL